MDGPRASLVAREGIPFLAAILILGLILILADRYLEGAVAGVLFTLAFLLFRDPIREIPPEPLGVVSPVDGTVTAVMPVGNGIVRDQEQKVVIRVNHLGSYTLRSPTEGKILALRDKPGAGGKLGKTKGLWLQTDEGDDVVLLFPRAWFWLTPTSSAQIGERLGQGQSCGYLRLAHEAELHLPIESRILVEPGQKVIAGVDIIGELPG